MYARLDLNQHRLLIRQLLSPLNYRRLEQYTGFDPVPRPWQGRVRPLTPILQRVVWCCDGHPRLPDIQGFTLLVVRGEGLEPPSASV
jgi:hypothetical protein